MEKRKFLLLTCTWGILLTIISIPVFIFMLIVADKPKRYGNCVYFEFGNYWGGIEFGWFFVVDKQPDKALLDHEYGHAIQNALYGPFFILLWIYGIARYWIRDLIKAIGLGKKLKPYDDAWNEGQATEWGAVYKEKYDEMYPNEEK